MNPKVFLSHASEDKDRFVLEFAEKLRAKGIDVWVDRWEMLPGDSLIDRIFEEGIKTAEAIIVILSKYSVSKPWVKEELNVSMVKKINGKSKLIPVVIEDCKVPECLQATLWEKINDLSDYGQSLGRIVDAILGHTTKPPIGAMPAYTRTVIDKLPGLNRIDSFVLKTSIDIAIEKGYPHVELKEIFSRAIEKEILEEQIKESIEVLIGRGHLDGSMDMGGDYRHIEITQYGFDQVARVLFRNYNLLVRKVGLCILNKGLKDTKAIVTELKEPKLVIDFIVRFYTYQGLLKHHITTDGNVHIHDISAELKRTLKNT